MYLLHMSGAGRRAELEEYQSSKYWSWVGGWGGGTNMGGILPLKMQRVSRGTNQIIITSAKRQKEPLILADDACELLNKFNIVFVIFCFGFFLQGDEKSMR